MLAVTSKTSQHARRQRCDGSLDSHDMVNSSESGQE